MSRATFERYVHVFGYEVAAVQAMRVYGVPFAQVQLWSLSLKRGGSNA